jgi:uncharacterized protein (TIGR02145 family)
MKTKKRIWFCPLIVMGFILILANSCKKDPPYMTDQDGNVYTSVTIGTQTWMVENLKTTKYNNGTDIPLAAESTTWAVLTTPGYCWYDNDIANKATYGAIYNWYAVNTGKLCPTGWHVPSDAEFTTLQTYLGGESVAGGKLKETGTAHWYTPNTDATNESDFTALPGGVRMYDGRFEYIKEIGYLNSSTEEMIGYCWVYSLYSNSGSFNRMPGVEVGGFSVRCLKD